MNPHPTQRPRLRSRVLAVAAALAAAGSLHAQIPAFPGAEGYGAYATGGRGGDVYYVTNLNTSGSGSFADAIATVPAAGRTIIFAVSGYIPVPSSNVRMTLNKVTVAGQTAPGDGIGFKGGTFRISADDIIFRHVRLRHGKYGSGGDCLDLDSASDRSIIDHISMQFSTDENMSSFNSPPDNVTLSYSLNAWGLESHSCGGLWDQNRATAHHTLWAHNHTRNPKARPATLLEWINNVTFDWDIGFIMGDSETPATWKSNVIGNYFLCPPGNLRSVALEKANIDRNGGRNFTIWVENNLFDKDGDGTLNGQDYGWGIASGSYIQAPARLDNTGSRAVMIDAPRLAYKKVVSNAGALRLDASAGIALRDEVDSILISKLMAQQRFHVTRESDTGASNAGFGFLNSSAAPLDSDRDGMPEAWETSLGWSTTVQDHNTALANAGGVLTGTTFFPAGTVAGYTRLEEYLHYKASPHATIARNTVDTPSSFTVDLRRYTLGFNNLSPTFTLSNIVGGTAVQSDTGGAVVTFTPTQGVAGRARFEFTVTDSQGDTWTQSFLMLVSSLGAPRDLSWVGNGSSHPWDTSSQLWAKGGSTVAFASGDNVLFDDRGAATPSISVPSTITAGTMTVDSSKNYTFTGAGALNVGGTLTKRGSGTLALNTTGSSSFLGIVNEAGALSVLQGGAAGSAKIQLAGGDLVLAPAIVSGSAATLTNVLEFNAPTTITIGSQHNALGNWTGSGAVLVNSSTGSLWTVGGVWTGYSGRLTLGTGTPRIRLNGSSTTNFGSSSLYIDLGAADGEFMNRNGGTTAYNIGTLAGGTNTKLFGTQTGTAASTYSIGGRNESSTFAGSIRNGGAGGLTHITKIGSGTLTLSGASTHTGTTTLNGGGIKLDGSFTGSPLVVNTGTTLSGVGSTTSLVTVNSGGKLAPGLSSGGLGTFTGTGGLTLNTGSTLACELAPTLAGGCDRVLVNGGTTTLSGAIAVNVSFLDPVAGVEPGVYRLLGGTSALTLTTPTLTVVPPAAVGTTRQSFSVAASASAPATIDLTVTGSPANLVWQGADGATWDLISTSGNFTGAAPSFFANLDRVTFGDSYGGTNVNVVGTLTPALVTVNSSRDFVFSGTGSFSGATKVVKNGTGSLNFNLGIASAFTGGVELNAGLLTLASTTNLGTGPLLINGGTLQLPNAAVFLNNEVVFTGSSKITSLYTGNSTIANSTSNKFRSVGQASLDLSGVLGILTINGPMDGFSGTISLGTSSAMLRLNQNSSLALDVNKGSTTTSFDLGTASARIANRNGGGTVEFGAISGGPNTVLQGRQSGSGDTSSTYRIGALGTNTTFAGSIQNAGDLAGLTIVKVGTGEWTLSGTSNFVGSLNIESGAIILPGSFTVSGNTNVQSGASLNLTSGALTCGALNVEEGATLTGAGTLNGDLNNRGTVTAAAGGQLTINGDVVNDGILRLTKGTELVATNAFVNNGVLDLMTAGGSLPPNLVNNGTVIDSSAVAMKSLTRDGNVFTITVASYSGHTYKLQTSTDLLGAWTSLDTQNGVTGSDLTFTHDPGAGSPRFYRLAVDE